MNSRLRSKKILKLVGLLVMLSMGASLVFFPAIGTVFTVFDYKVLDSYYRQAVRWGRGPQTSPQIVYVTITDNSYKYFGKNYLDREDLAKVNNALVELGVAAVAYDIIFAQPSNPESDQSFTESLKSLDTVFLPIGFALSNKPQPFRWEEGSAYDKLRADYLRKPVEAGPSRPFYALRAIMQYHAFAEATRHSGHISAYADPDGAYRHVLMLLRVDDRYFPTLSLAMFLDYAKIPFEKIVVEWGRRIIIPALKGSLLEKDMILPIDEQGRTFVPFSQPWEKEFQKIEAHNLIEYFKDEDLRGNLSDLFEGRFVIIGDISIGTADLGQTPLDKDVPLMVLHASMLNGMLTNTFYSPWHLWAIVALTCLISVLLGVAAVPRASWVLYLSGAAIMSGLFGLTWWEFIHFRLFPIFMVGFHSLIILGVLIASLEIVTSKDRAFIRNAFARYVPEKVVHELLANPESLKLGGEERVISVLFSDLAGFTTISEKMTPQELAKLLNEYLTEMTRIVLSHGGIIDKYEGDAIMAEFGAPLPMPDHAHKAVMAGLRMQQRLVEMRRSWAERGLPELRCRIGINTGPMIVGNMGSEQVFDFTVIGDHVNLASRLESANKRYDTFLMISEFTHSHLSADLFRTRILDVIKVKGKSKAVKVYEVYEEASKVMAPEDELYYRVYDEAFRSFLAKDFTTAREKFQTALNIRPHDPASKGVIARMAGLKPAELPDNWDGSVELNSK